MMRITILLAASLAFPAFATGDKHIPKNPLPPKTVYVQEKDGHRDAWAVATAAGIAYWLHRRHKRRHAPPPDVRIVPAECPAYQCPVTTCDAQTERALASCGVSK